MQTSPSLATTDYPNDHTQESDVSGDFNVAKNSDGTYQTRSTIAFSKTTTLSDEYTTADLVLPFSVDPNTTWTGGSGSASVVIEDQTSSSLTGSRVRFDVVGPKGNFKFSYVTTISFSASDSFPAFTTSVTNSFVAKGDGVSMETIPCGEGLPVMALYVKTGGGDCSIYYGGTASISSGGISLIVPDDKDKPPACTACQACAQNSNITPQDYSTLIPPSDPSDDDDDDDPEAPARRWIPTVTATTRWDGGRESPARTVRRWVTATITSASLPAPRERNPTGRRASTRTSLTRMTRRGRERSILVALAKWYGVGRHF
jgi:hypothetical protein